MKQLAKFTDLWTESGETTDWSWPIPQRLDLKRQAKVIEAEVDKFTDLAMDHDAGPLAAQIAKALWESLRVEIDEDLGTVTVRSILDADLFLEYRMSDEDKARLVTVEEELASYLAGALNEDG